MEDWANELSETVDNYIIAEDREYIIEDREVDSRIEGEKKEEDEISNKEKEKLLRSLVENKLFY